MTRKVFKPSLIAPRIAFILATVVFLGATVLAEDSAAQQNQNSDTAEVHVLPVQGSVYMVAGSGANITLQVGQQGVLLVDTGNVQLSDKVIAAIRKLSDKPIRVIINTNVDPDHVGGNENIWQGGAHSHGRCCLLQCAGYITGRADPGP